MSKSFGKYLMFLLSPILSLPLILRDLYSNKNSSLILISLTFGIVSFLYIPRESNDKAYYHLLYENLSSLDIQGFFIFLSEKPDFLFYTLLYLFSKSGIPIQFLFLFITALTVWIWLFSFRKFTNHNNLKTKDYFIFLTLILISFSIDHLISGVRNYLAFSFILLGFLSSGINNNKTKGLLYIILAIAIHFSSIIFLPFYFIFILFPKRYNFYKFLFIFSFIFIITPRELLLQFADQLKLPSAIQNKAESYLGEKDFIENSLSIGNFNNYLKIFFYELWTFFAWAYLFITINRKSIFRNLTYTSFAVSNLFYSAPDTYYRYILVAQFFFLVLLLVEYDFYSKFLKFSKILLVVFALNLLGNIYVYREQFIKSYFNINSTTLITILLKEDITSKDFIK